MRWALVFLAGCDGAGLAFREEWVALNELERPFEGPGEFGLQVTTTPEAWPDEVRGDAVRAQFRGPGTLRSLDEEHELLQGGPRWVNVIDAMGDCPRDEVCVREFWFAVDCDEACAGVVSADAFLSKWAVRQQTVREGALRLDWIAP